MGLYYKKEEQDKETKKPTFWETTKSLLNPSSPTNVFRAPVKKVDQILTELAPPTIDPLLKQRLQEKGRFDDLQNLEKEGIVVPGLDSLYTPLNQLTPEQEAYFGNKMIRNIALEKVKQEDYDRQITETGQYAARDYTQEAEGRLQEVIDSIKKKKSLVVNINEVFEDEDIQESIRKIVDSYDQGGYPIDQKLIDNLNEEIVNLVDPDYLTYEDINKAYISRYVEPTEPTISIINEAKEKLIKDSIKYEINPVDVSRIIPEKMNEFNGMVQSVWLTGSNVKSGLLLENSGMLFNSSYPLISDYLKPFKMFDESGQLYPEVKALMDERTKIAFSDTSSSLVFSQASGMFPFQGPVPLVSSALGTISYLRGDNNSVVLSNMMVGTTMPGLSVLTQDQIEDVIKNVAKGALTQNTDIEIRDNYTNEDINLAQETAIRNAENIEDVDSAKRSAEYLKSLDASDRTFVGIGKTAKDQQKNIKTMGEELKAIADTDEDFSFAPASVNEVVQPTTKEKPKTSGFSFIIGDMKTNPVNQDTFNLLTSNQGKINFDTRFSTLETIFNKANPEDKKKIGNRIDILDAIGKQLGYVGNRITDAVSRLSEDIKENIPIIAQLSEKVSAAESKPLEEIDTPHKKEGETWGEFLKRRPELALTTEPDPLIEYIDKYENIVGPFARRMPLTRAGLAVAEKLVGKQLASTYEEIVQRAPVTAVVSGLVGDIWGLLAVSQIIGGFLPTIQFTPWQKAAYPYLTRYAPEAIHLAATWGIKGFIDESLNQFEKGKFSAKKLANETAKEILFGTFLAGVEVIEPTTTRIVTAGAYRAGWTALSKYIENGKIKAEDMLDIVANAILAILFESINASGITAQMRQERIDDFGKTYLIARMTSNGIPEPEALEIADTLAKLGSLQQIPPAIMEKLPAEFIGIHMLPDNEQVQLAKVMTDMIKTNVNSGQTLWDSVSNSLATTFSLPQVDISAGLSIKEVTPAGSSALPKVKVPSIEKETAEILRGTKGMTADDIMKEYPDIKLEKDVPAKDVYGNKIEIPEGEVLTPYELKGNKVLLQDGETYIVSRNQFQNIKGQSTSKEVSEFAPELKGTEETIKGASKWRGNELIDNGEVVANLIKNDDGTWSYQSDFSEGSERFRTKKEAMEYAEADVFGIYSGRETKYEQYQLPGGKDYKEILIQAPELPKEKAKYVLEKSPNPDSERPWRIRDVSQTLHLLSFKTKEEAQEKLKAIEDRGYMTDRNFKSPHWEEPNVISHIRMNERTYDGKKVSFLEELQSDWAREGREKGFGIGISFEEAQKNAEDYLSSLYKKYNSKDMAKVLDKLATKEEHDRYYELSDLANKAGAAVPAQPLLKSWTELSIKRALQEAVANKSDYFAWISGEQTTARYNLATLVEKVGWKIIDKKKTIEIKSKDKGTFLVMIDVNGEIVQGTREAIQWKGKKLDEVLGKGLADKIMEKDSGTLSGEGLKFGGEWAENLYDKQVANIVKDLTGAKIEKLDMGLPIEASKTRFETVDMAGGDTNLDKALSHIKVGNEVYNSGNLTSYIITDVLEEGKFKATAKELFKGIKNPKEYLESLSDRQRKGIGEIFDISTKTTTQQGIKLTPEVKAIIKGEAPTFKASGKKFEEVKPTKLPIKPAELSKESLTESIGLIKKTALKLPTSEEKSKAIGDILRSKYPDLSDKQIKSLKSVAGKILKGKNYDTAVNEVFGIAGKEVVPEKAVKPTEIKKVERVKIPKETKLPEATIKVSKVSSKIPASIGAFMKEDILPIKDLTIEASKKIGRSFKNHLAPETISNRAELTASVIRRKQAELSRYKDITWKLGQEKAKWWDKVDKKIKTEFLFSMEEGKLNENIEKIVKDKDEVRLLNSIMKEYRLRLENAYMVSASVDERIGYIKNYFPHIWKNRAKAIKFLREWEARIGKEKFSKQRFINSIREGLKYGLELATYNPEELVTMREVSAWQAKTQLDIIEELKDSGLLKSPARAKKLEGFSILSTPYGQYGMPDEVVHVINNWLRPGLWEESRTRGMLFRGGMELKNFTVAAKLFLSTYQYVATSLSSYGVQGMIIGKDIANKDIGKFFADIAKWPVIPFIDVVQGSRIKKAWYNKPRNEFEQQALDWLQRAGGRPLMSKIYRINARKNFVQAVHEGNYPGAAVRFIPAAMELFVTPLFDMWTPGLKLASFTKLAGEYVKSHPQITGRKLDMALARIWNNTDNRFGQMVTDNLFWNPIIKDVAIASTLSLGWNLGTIRELGGAIVDTGKALGNLAKLKKPEITEKMQFTVAYTIAWMFFCGLLTYAFTGERPKKMLDYFYPRLASGERLQGPTMLKEVFRTYNIYQKYGISKGTFRLVQNKLTPVLNTLWRIWENEDFYGTEVYSPRDELYKKAWDISKFIVTKDVTPIPIDTFLREKKLGRETIMPFLGFIEAPKYITTTKTAKMIEELWERRFGGAVISKEEREKRKAKSVLRTKYQEGNLTHGELSDAVKNGIITRQGLKTFLKEALLPSDIRLFQMLASSDQNALLLDMNDKDIKRYLPYANKEIKIKWKYRGR